MRIVLAPDSFKGSVSALGVAEAMERGIHAVFPDADVLKVPIADGGVATLRYAFFISSAEEVLLTPNIS